MVAIDIRTKRYAPVGEFANPVEFSIEGEVLENAEHADYEAEAHSKPHKCAPVLKRAKRLHAQKQKKQGSQQKQQLNACAEGRCGRAKEPLAQADEKKEGKRGEQGR